MVAGITLKDKHVKAPSILFVYIHVGACDGVDILYTFVAGSDSHVSMIVLLFPVAFENLLQMAWLSVNKYGLPFQCLKSALSLSSMLHCLLIL